MIAWEAPVEAVAAGVAAAVTLVTLARHGFRHAVQDIVKTSQAELIKRQIDFETRQGQHLDRQDQRLERIERKLNQANRRLRPEPPRTGHRSQSVSGPTQLATPPACNRHTAEAGTAQPETPGASQPRGRPGPPARSRLSATSQAPG
jgi:hypothetical protein